MGLQDYLTFSVQALERIAEFPVVHVVTGNEACDLDSAISAIAYAYFLHETSLAPVGTALFLPLLNIPRSEFPLRTEVAYFLGKFGISPDDLVFQDDLDLGQVKVKAGSELKLTLVDHHVLSGTAMADLEDCVVQILDHRTIDGDLPDRCESTVELVGSCSTLVAEAMLGEETFTMDPVCATLLYGTIVTDTINFSPAVGKATAKDLDIAEQLEDSVDGGIDRDSLYEEVKAAKFDLSGLTSKEILRKDLKMVRGDSLMVAICSITMGIKELTERADFEDSLKSFAQDRAVDAVLVLTLCSGPDDSVTRQLGVFSPSRVYRQQMADVLSTSQSPSLALSPLTFEVADLLTFSQGNVKASRKEILPVVKAFLAGETTPDEMHSDAYDDLPKDQSEGFSSMSGIVGGRNNQNAAGATAAISDGEEITSEELISRDDSTENDLFSENLLPVDRKIFDPLSSVHSSDSGAPSPQDRRGSGGAVEKMLPLVAGDEVALFDDVSGLPVTFSADGDSSENVGGGRKDSGSLDLGGGEDDIQNSVNVSASGEDAGSVQAPALLDDEDSPLVSQNQNPVLNMSPPSPDEEPGETPAWSNNSNHANNHANNHHNDHDVDPSQHNGLGEIDDIGDGGGGGGGGDDDDNDDALEQDFLNMASPHDLLFPAESPLDALSAATSGQVSGQTSGQTSGQGSKAPSYPVTPPNSYMDDGVIDKEVNLPSFNSQEMVEKIHERQAALDRRGDGDGERDGEGEGQRGGGGSRTASGSSQDTPDPPLSPFTPHNSYVDTPVSPHPPGASLAAAAVSPRPKETQLPSFHSSDMVERIREKRSSMEREVQGMAAGAQEGGRSSSPSSSSSPPAPILLLEAERGPFTPHNSYVEGGFDRFARENLPSLNSAEIANRIRQKQAELNFAASGEGGSANGGGGGGGGGRGGGGEGEDSGTASPAGAVEGADSPFAPYTPQNSFRDTPLWALNALDSRMTDLNEVAERLSLTGSESSGSLNEPKSVKASNRVYMLSPQETSAEAGGFDPAPDRDGSSSEASSPEQEQSVKERSDLISESAGLKRKGVSFSQPQNDQNVDNSDSAALAEEAIQKIAYELANEMIQKALETFPSESVVKEMTPGSEGQALGGGGGRELELERRPMHPSISEDSSPTMDESDREDNSGFSEAAGSLETTAVGVGGGGGETAYYEDAGTPDSAMVSSSESSDQLMAVHFSQQEQEFAQSAMKMSSSLADELAQALRGGGNDDGRGVSSESPDEHGPLPPPSSKKRSSSYEEEEDEEERPNEREEVPKSARYEIETEYLCDMDPTQKVGAFHPPDTSIIQTDAGKEVVEGASFRKISGQEYQTVQEEILEQIRQEAKEREVTQLLRASATEGGGGGLPSSSTETDDAENHQEKKKITLEEELNLDDSLTDEQGKKTLRASRDRELYASTLENERAVIDVDHQRTLQAQPSDASHAHPLLLDNNSAATAEDESTTEPGSSSTRTPSASASGSAQQQPKKKIETCRWTEGRGEDFSYESFAGPGSVEVKEGKKKTTTGGGGVSRTVSSVSESSLKGVELCDEWQDDELPRMLGAEDRDVSGDSQGASAAAEANRKRVVPDPGLAVAGKGDNLDDVEVVDSDSEVDSNMDNDQLEWETRKLLRDDTPVRTPPPAKKRAAEEEAIPQYTAAEERRDAAAWKVVRLGEGGEAFRLDMRVIEPYKRVLSHGGYCGQGLTAMIVFSACYLPSRDRRDYSYVMNHLFHYVLHTLDELVADDYMIVYFHGATPRRQMPSFTWLKRCYQAIDRRLKKNLRALYLVHPTLWLKTVVVMTRPFISVKFSSKLLFVRTLSDLKRLIPMEYVYIPDIVQRYDDRHFHPTAPSASSSSTSTVQQ